MGWNTQINCAYTRLFSGRFSGKWRVVDLPEIWGFWRFYLEFWVNVWVFEQFCLILDKICYIWIKIFLNFWKICQNFGQKILEFWVFGAWVWVFSPWVFERMSKKQACTNWLFFSLAVRLPLSDRLFWGVVVTSSRPLRTRFAPTPWRRVRGPN